MTRTAAAARVARARHFSNTLQSARGDLTFDSAFGNKETRADKCFVAGPVVARGVTVLTNRRQQRITRQFRTMLSPCFQLRQVSCQCAAILPDDGGFGSRDIQNPFGQHRQRRHEHTTTRRLKPRLRHHLPLVDLYRKPRVRAADQRRRPANKTRLVRIAYVLRVEEMICCNFRQY